MSLKTPEITLALPVYMPRPGPSPYFSGSITPALHRQSSFLSSHDGVDVPLAPLRGASDQTPPMACLHPPIFGTKRPLALAAAAAAGKLVMAVGASAAVKAAYADSVGDTAVGSAMLVGGFGAALTAAIMFGNDVHASAPPRTAWTLKAVSISAALTLASSSALHQVFVDKDRASYGWVPFALGTLGYVLLCTSLPAFFCYSEARHGQAIVGHRQAITRSLGALGFACGFSWAANISGQVKLPPYVGPVTLTLCATSVVLSFALSTSDSRRSCS